MQATIYRAKNAIVTFSATFLSKLNSILTKAKRWAFYQWYRLKRFTFNSKTAFAQLYSEQPRRCFLYMGLGAVIVLLIIYWFFKPNHDAATTVNSYQQADTMLESAEGVVFSSTDIDARLITLANQIAELEILVNKGRDLESITAQIDELKAVVDTAITTEMFIYLQRQVQVLADSWNTVSQQLNNLPSESTHTNTHTGRQENNNQTLPFRVLAVDIWNGKPYASIELEGREALLGYGEARLGWRVSEIDFMTQTIVFKNRNEQSITVVLEE